MSVTWYYYMSVTCVDRGWVESQLGQRTHLKDVVTATEEVWRNCVHGVKTYIVETNRSNGET